VIPLEGKGKGASVHGQKRDGGEVVAGGARGLGDGGIRKIIIRRGDLR